MAGGIGDLAVTLPQLSVGPSVAGIGGSGAPVTIPALQPDAAAATPNFGFNPTINDAIARAAQNNPGISTSYLAQMAQIESGGNPNAKNDGSGAAGLYQFIPSTARAMGLSNPYDPYAAADAAAKYALQNKNLLTTALGRAPTDGELYLAHQQGGAGARGILGNPNGLAADTVGRSAITSNGGSPSMTNQQFANLWTSKFGGSNPGTANPGMSVGSTATQGGFGLNGIQAQGGPVAGQGAPPGVSSLVNQPMTAMGPTAQSMPGVGAAPTDQQSLLQKLMGNNSLSSLTGAAGALGKTGQQGQQKQGGGGMNLGQPYRPSPVGLQQAQSMFDPSRFYQMLSNANILTGRPMTPGQMPQAGGQ